MRLSILDKLGLHIISVNKYRYVNFYWEIKLKKNSLSCDNQEIFFGTKAILLGSIGSIVETSELQLAAFNEAFKKFGLDWEWTTSQYKPMLVQAGGRKRIKEFSKVTNISLSDEEIEKVYTMKGDYFVDFLESVEMEPRNGVRELMEQSACEGIKLGWVTTTSEQNISAIKNSLNNKIDFGLFEVITSREQCLEPKPSPMVYKKALEFLAVGAKMAVAIEDSNSGVSSSKQAGIFTIAFPGEYGKDHDFSRADICLENLNKISLSS